jgi:hypothetical protein
MEKSDVEEVKEEEHMSVDAVDGDDEMGDVEESPKRKGKGRGIIHFSLLSHQSMTCLFDSVAAPLTPSPISKRNPYFLDPHLVEASTIIKPDSVTESGMTSAQATKHLGALIVLPDFIQTSFLDISKEDLVMLYAEMGKNLFRKRKEAEPGLSPECKRVRIHYARSDSYETGSTSEEESEAQPKILEEEMVGPEDEEMGDEPDTEDEDEEKKGSISL